VDHDAALEQMAMDGVVSSGINADPLDARVVRVLEEGPSSRLVDVAVVMRSRMMANTCTWGTYRYRQGSLGVKKLGLVDRGRVDCNDPALGGPSRTTSASAPPADTQAAARIQSGCAQMIAHTKETYCDRRPATAPAGYVDMIKQQRDSIAATCSDASSAQALAQLDACIAELKAHP
jgi:hypothetical protein